MCTSRNPWTSIHSSQLSTHPQQSRSNQENTKQMKGKICLLRQTFLVCGESESFSFKILSTLQNFWAPVCRQTLLGSWPTTARSRVVVEWPQTVRISRAKLCFASLTQKIPAGFCWRPNFILCANFFRTKVSGDSDNEFRHDRASTPANRTSLPYGISSRLASVPAPSHPPSPRHRIHSRFFGATSFLIWYVGGGLGRVSPKGETDGIQTTVLPTLCGYSTILIRLGHSFGLVVVYHFAFTSPRPKRNRSEAPIQGVLAPPTVRAPISRHSDALAGSSHEPNGSHRGIWAVTLP